MSDSTNLLVDPHAFNEWIKTVKALTAAFAPPKPRITQGTNNNWNWSDKQVQQPRHQNKGNNSDRSSHCSSKGNNNNHDSNDDFDNNHGHQWSSFQGAKGKETRRDS